MDAMKTSFIVIAFLLLVAVGYFAFMQPSTSQLQTSDTNSQAGKIDINAVCEGALAYMTFPSGAEADVWVRECKEGKHPEAIEQWKQQQGIADDRAI